MSARKKAAKQATASMIGGALVEFVRAESAFSDGLKLLKAAQKDFTACAANKNLYSHALRALRHISQQSCEFSRAQFVHEDCDVAIAAGARSAEARCWPCFARDALRRGGDRQ